MCVFHRFGDKQVPDRTTFESAYAGVAPWDIDRPQKAFIESADQITGSILDAGSGIRLDHKTLVTANWHGSR